jgi:hypothetical protein
MAAHPEPATVAPNEHQSERLDNAPLTIKHRGDTHIAGAQELRTAVELADAEEDEGVAEAQELEELEADATAALAEGMGADDARNEPILDDTEDDLESALQADLFGEPDATIEPVGTPSPTER